MKNGHKTHTTLRAQSHQKKNDPKKPKLELYIVFSSSKADHFRFDQDNFEIVAIISTGQIIAIIWDNNIDKCDFVIIPR